MSPPPTRRLVATLLGLGLLAALVLGLVRLGQSTRLGELKREGPAAVVVGTDESARLWLMTRRTEERRAAPRGLADARRQHLELRVFDSRSGQPVWMRRLRTVFDDEGGHGARARILGREAERVWLFVHDQAVAVAPADGAVRATALDILAANPSLNGLLPTTLDDYAFDDGLVFIAADGRRLRIAGTTLQAAAYTPASEEDFDRRRFMAGRWHGGYETRRFLTPQAQTPAGWLGLYTEAEAKQAGDDGFGDHLKDPDRTWRDDRLARRMLWTARIGRTREFSEGSHPRLFDLQALAGSPEFLQGGFLVEAGRRTPLQPTPGALLVLHRSRIDEAGRARLTRLQVDAGQPPRSTWTAALPFADLHSRWQFPDRLLLMGQATHLDDEGRPRVHEHIAVVDLASGAVRGWDSTEDLPLTPDVSGSGVGGSGVGR